TTTIFGGGTFGGGTTTTGRSQHGAGGGGGGGVGLQPEWHGGRVGQPPLPQADASVGRRKSPSAATPNAIAARMYRAGTVICRCSLISPTQVQAGGHTSRAAGKRNGKTRYSLAPLGRGPCVRARALEHKSRRLRLMMG